VPPLRELLSLHSLSMSELAVALGFAILPGLVVAIRRVHKAGGNRHQPDDSVKVVRR
jgi:hypothetical protein